MLQATLLIDALQQNGFQLVQLDDVAMLQSACCPFCMIRDGYPLSVINTMVESVTDEFNEYGVTRFAASIEPWEGVGGSLTLDLYGY
jgi:hypothetical protein